MEKSYPHVVLPLREQGEPVAVGEDTGHHVTEEPLDADGHLDVAALIKLKEAITDERT